MNYFLDNKINRVEILFPGVACFLIAVCLGSFVHTSNAKDNQAKLDRLISNGPSTSSGKNVCIFCFILFDSNLILLVDSNLILLVTSLTF